MICSCLNGYSLVYGFAWEVIYYDKNVFIVVLFFGDWVVVKYFLERENLESFIYIGKSKYI